AIAALPCLAGGWIDPAVLESRLAHGADPADAAWAQTRATLAPPHARLVPRFDYLGPGDHDLFRRLAFEPVGGEHDPATQWLLALMARPGLRRWNETAWAGDAG